MIALIIGGSFSWLIIQCIVGMLINYNWVCRGLTFLQPDIIYDNTKLNYFGVGVVCLMLNLFFLPMALCYWFYKLCTVGRR
jgi:hypothetical protein